MKLIHGVITSHLFKLIGTYELDINFELADESFTWRVELFQSQSDSTLYRYRSYRTEMYRVNPSAPLFIIK